MGVLCILLLASLQDPTFEEKDTSAMIKASFLYNFSKLIDWPTTAKSGNFVISVMGGGNMYTELAKKYNDKRVGSQQIEIRKIPKTTNLQPCQVLFVGRDCSDMIQSLSAVLKGQSTLLVSDSPEGLKKGAVINFIVDNHNYNFEVSVQNAEAHQLFVGATLKSLAHHVED